MIIQVAFVELSLNQKKIDLISFILFKLSSLLMLKLEHSVISSERWSYSLNSEHQSDSDLRVSSYNNECKKRRLQHSKTVKDAWSVRKDKEW